MPEGGDSVELMRTKWPEEEDTKSDVGRRLLQT